MYIVVELYLHIKQVQISQDCNKINATAVQVKRVFFKTNTYTLL